jgi:hypothetical protein
MPPLQCSFTKLRTSKATAVAINNLAQIIWLFVRTGGSRHEKAAAGFDVSDGFCCGFSRRPPEGHVDRDSEGLSFH